MRSSIMTVPDDSLLIYFVFRINIILCVKINFNIWISIILFQNTLYDKLNEKKNDTFNYNIGFLEKDDVQLC